MEDATVESVPVVVVGAGPAGLATSAELARHRVAHVVLERGPAVGHSWANAYDSLTLHTGRHMSALPGMPFPRGTPLFPARRHFLDYLRAYAADLSLPVRFGAEVLSVAHGPNGWLLRASSGAVRARALVWATGIMSNPFQPQLPGEAAFRGRILHSVDYRRPGEFAGRRVLVVGVGNSGAEIGSELARAGAVVTVAVRSGANVVPRTLLGVPIQYLAHVVRKLPRPAASAVTALVGRLTELRRGPPVLPRPAHGPLDAIPLIGFSLVDAIREGSVAVKPALETLTADGVRFIDGSERMFDVILLATGFRPALAPLAGLVATDASGFARRTDRVTSLDQPDLYFVGHNYDASGGLFNIRRDSRLAALKIAQSLTSATRPRASRVPPRRRRS